MKLHAKRTCYSKFFPSSGLLHSVTLFETDVSGLPMDPIFKGQAVQEDTSPLKWDR